jgi:hypothetical protein
MAESSDRARTPDEAGAVTAQRSLVSLAFEVKEP